MIQEKTWPDIHNMTDILSLPWIEKKKSSGILSISSGTLLCIDTMGFWNELTPGVVNP